MSKFKVGDTVKYVGAKFKELDGLHGKVVAVGTDFLYAFVGVNFLVVGTKLIHESILELIVENKESEIMKRKLNVGDTFVVTSKEERKDWVDEMDKFIGKVVTISKVVDRIESHFIIREDGGCRVWRDTFGHIDWEKTNALYYLPQPQKSLLKSGDMVILRDGRVLDFLESYWTLHGTNGDRVTFLSYYTNSLYWISEKEYNNHPMDIMQVYRNGELIMQRTEKSAKEIRAEEIEAEIAKLQKELSGLK